MTDKRKKACCELYEAMECGSSFIRKYNTLPRNYFGYRLFPAETHMLQYIGHHPEITTWQLAAAMKKTTSAVSQLVKKLKQHGLLVVIQNPENNRESFLRLNEAGWKIYTAHEELDRCMMSRFSSALQDFSAEDIERCICIQEILNKKFAENLQILQEENQT